MSKTLQETFPGFAASWFCQWKIPVSPGASLLQHTMLLLQPASLSTTGTNNSSTSPARVVLPSTSLVLFPFAPQVVTVLYPEVFRSSLYLSWAPQFFLQPPLPVAWCRRSRRQGAERCWPGSRAAPATRWLCRPGVCLIPPACLDQEVSMGPEHPILLRLAASDGLFSPVTQLSLRRGKAEVHFSRTGQDFALHFVGFQPASVQVLEN